MYIFNPQPISTVAIDQSEKLFPVRHIYCVGRNYKHQTKGVGLDTVIDPTKESPAFFMKPADAITTANKKQQIEVVYPAQTKNYYYEIELVVAIGKDGKNILVETASDYIFGYGVGLDMTRRDLQEFAKEHQYSWEVSKAFPQSALIDKIYPKSQVGELNQANLELKVNGVVKQNSNLDQLIWSIPYVIHYLSKYFELKAGDLIYTGTPAGLGPVVTGDIIDAKIEKLGALTVKIK